MSRGDPGSSRGFLLVVICCDPVAAVQSDKAKANGRRVRLINRRAVPCSFSAGRRLRLFSSGNNISRLVSDIERAASVMRPEISPPCALVRAPRRAAGSSLCGSGEVVRLRDVCALQPVKPRTGSCKLLGAPNPRIGTRKNAASHRASTPNRSRPFYVAFGDVQGRQKFATKEVNSIRTEQVRFWGSAALPFV